MTNPTPQPHADDAEVIKNYIDELYTDNKSLRLSNEALRERVKELELACLNLNNDLTGQGAYINIIRDKLTAASKIITKCEGALQAAIKPLSEIADIDSETRAGWGHKAVDEALQHIAKWKQP